MRIWIWKMSRNSQLLKKIYESETAHTGFSFQFDGRCCDVRSRCQRVLEQFPETEILFVSRPQFQPMFEGIENLKFFPQI